MSQCLALSATVTVLHCLGLRDQCHIILHTNYTIGAKSLELSGMICVYLDIQEEIQEKAIKLYML